MASVRLPFERATVKNGTALYPTWDLPSATDSSSEVIIVDPVIPEALSVYGSPYSFAYTAVDESGNEEYCNLEARTL